LIVSTINNTTSNFFAFKAIVNKPDAKAIVSAQGNDENFVVYGDGTLVRGSGMKSMSFGSACVSSFYFTHSYIGFNAVRTNNKWHIKGDYSNNGAGIICANAVGDIRFLTIPRDGGADRDLDDQTVSANSKMIIRANGSVGIGTENFDENVFKLAVKGSILAKEIKVSVALLPDYVFDSSYYLRSINDVEDYIKENKHLPEVPSQAEASKNGINVSEMNSILLKKIEELTLYVIEQNKKIENLQNEVNNLKK